MAAPLTQARQVPLVLICPDADVLFSQLDGLS